MASYSATVSIDQGGLVLQRPTFKINTFEGGSDGVTVSAANSGGASGNAFNSVNVTSGHCTYSTTNYHDGAVGLWVNPTGSTEANFVRWADTNLSGRFTAWIKPEGLPSTYFSFCNVVATTGYPRYLSVDSAGAIGVGRIGSSFLAKSANSIISGGNWYYIDYSYDLSVAVDLLKVYDSSMSMVATVSYTSGTYTASATSTVQFGHISKVDTNVYDLIFDQVAVYAPETSALTSTIAGTGAVSALGNLSEGGITKHGEVTIAQTAETTNDPGVMVRIATTTIAQIAGLAGTPGTTQTAGVSIDSTAGITSAGARNWEGYLIQYGELEAEVTTYEGPEASILYNDAEWPNPISLTQNADYLNEDPWTEVEGKVGWIGVAEPDSDSLSVVPVQGDWCFNTGYTKFQYYPWMETPARLPTEQCWTKWDFHDAAVDVSFYWSAVAGPSTGLLSDVTIMRVESPYEPYYMNVGIRQDGSPFIRRWVGTGDVGILAEGGVCFTGIGPASDPIYADDGEWIYVHFTWEANAGDWTIEVENTLNPLLTWSASGNIAPYNSQNYIKYVYFGDVIGSGSYHAPRWPPVVPPPPYLGAGFPVYVWDVCQVKNMNGGYYSHHYATIEGEFSLNSLTGSVTPVGGTAGLTAVGVVTDGGKRTTTVGQTSALAVEGSLSPGGAFINQTAGLTATATVDDTHKSVVLYSLAELPATCGGVVSPAGLFELTAEGSISISALVSQSGALTVASRAVQPSPVVELSGRAALTAAPLADSHSPAPLAQVAGLSVVGSTPHDSTVAAPFVSAVTAVGKIRCVVVLAQEALVDPFPGARRSVVLAGEAALTGEGAGVSARSVEMAQASDLSNVASPSFNHGAVLLNQIGRVYPSLNLIDFPARPMPVKIEIQFLGEWVDVSTYALVNAGLNRTMWRGNGGVTDPGRCGFTLRSPDGIFNFRNTASEYWDPDGWDGAGVRVTVDNVPFFCGNVLEYATTYDEDGDEYFNVTVGGPLAVPYETVAETDPVGDVFLRSAPAPTFYWPMTESLGSVEFASGLPGGDPMRIGGAIRGMSGGELAKKVGTVDGPPGSPFKFMDFAYETTAESMDSTVDVRGPYVGPSAPTLTDSGHAYWGGGIPKSAVAWTSPSGAPAWDTGAFSVEFAFKLETGVVRTSWYDSELTRFDPGMYPDGYDAAWTERGAEYLSTSTKYTIDGVEFTSTWKDMYDMIHVRFADGNALVVGFDPFDYYSGSGTELRDYTKSCTSYVTASVLSMRYGKHVTPGRISAVDSSDPGPYLWHTRKIRHIIEDDRWHHVRAAIVKSGSTTEVRIYLDGVFLPVTLYDYYSNEYGDQLWYPVGSIRVSAPVALYVLGLDATKLSFKKLGIGYIAMRRGTDWPEQPALAVSGHPGELASARAKRIVEASGGTWADGEPSEVPLGTQIDPTMPGAIQAAEIADFGRVIELSDGSVTWESPLVRYGQAGFTFDLAHDQLGSAPQLGGPGTGVLSSMTATGEETSGVTSAFRADGYPKGSASSEKVGLISPARVAAWASARASWNRPNTDNTVTLHLDLAATPELIRTWLTATYRPPISIRVTGIPGVYDPLELFVEGFEESVGDFDWDVTLHCVPAYPYQAGWLEAGPRVTIMDISSVLAKAVTEAETTLRVYSPSLPSMSTEAGDYPVSIVSRGEEIEVASATTLPGTFVGAGAFVGGLATDPLVVPIPVWATTGHTLLLAVATNGPGEIVTPSGWTALAVNQVESELSVRLFARDYLGTIPATVDVSSTSTGHVVGQCCAFSGCAPVALDVQYEDSYTRTDILAPQAEWQSTLGNLITLHVGARKNGWASAEAPLRATLIGQSYQPGVGLVWAYGAPRGGLEPGYFYFPVDGGSGCSASMAVALASDIQELSVTRAVNGISRPLSMGQGFSLESCPVVSL